MYQSKSSIVSFDKEQEAFFISRRRMRNYHGHHFHDFFELLYLFSGERCFFINDRSFKMEAGDLILIGPNVFHKAISVESPDCEGILIYFQEGFLRPNKPLREVLLQLFANQTVSCRLDIQERERIETVFQQLLAENRQKNPGYSLALQAFLLQLLVGLDRYLDDSRASGLKHPSPMHEKVSEIVKYINQNYQESLSLTTVAGKFFLSPSYLSKVFKDVTDFTFVEYLNNVRVKESKRMLAETRKKVVEIAAEAGFGSVTHFGRVFKEITGHHPLYYRKQG